MIVAATALAIQPLPANFDLADYEPVVIVEPVAVVDTRRERTIERRRIAYHILNAADLATTAYCMEIADNCYEANGLYGNKLERVVLGKVLSAVVYEYVLGALRETGDQRIIDIYQISSIAITGSVVTWNIRVLL